MEVNDRDILRAIDRSNIGYAIFDRDSRITYASDTARYLLGFSREADIVGRKWYALDHDTEAMQRQRLDVYETFIDKPVPWQGILRWVWPDGEKRYYDSTATAYSADETIIVINDRTDQIRADRSVEDRERLTSTILDHLPVSVLLQDRNGSILYINSSLLRLLDAESSDLIGRKPADTALHFLRPELEGYFRQVVDTGQPIIGRSLHVTAGALKDTHWLINLYPIYDKNGKLDRVLTVEFDRTERARLGKEKAHYQQKLYELQKVEALNRFAGGLAHELSNILHPAGVYARALQHQPDREDRGTLLDRINKAVLEAGIILRRTLDMSHDSREGLKPVEIIGFLHQLIAYAQDVAPKNLVYEFTASETSLVAFADRTELQQVMLNLMVNASDAQGGEGNIRITAGRGGTPPADLDIVPSSAGPFVWIDVIDHGTGMTAEVRSQIFDPFFTTKTKEKGTGLGLAVVQGMVTGWGGVVSVDTTPDKGSTFRVWIPESRSRPGAES